MAKNKRKPSSAQRDKTNISIAKKLKSAGILSKQANLHSGAYISKEVLRKVRDYEHQARLGYKAIAVPKEVAKAAKERGYQVVQGNRIIGPATPQFRNRLKRGEVTGIKPVKGGFMEEVILPHSVMDMRSLVEQLELGIDTLKMNDEMFAFKYHGHESWRAFFNSEQLLEYLRHYKGIKGLTTSMKAEDLQEEFEGLSIFRLHKESQGVNIPGPRARRERAKEERMEAIRRGEYVPRRKYKSKYEKAERYEGRVKERYLAKLAKQDKARRERIASDPAKLEAYRKAAKARAKKSRDNRKAK